MISAERLRELLDYDPDTGLFTWRPSRICGRVRFNGKTAGNVKPDGYRRINIDGRLYYSGRLAWLWMTGEWPSAEIDHADCDPSNDRFVNLRPANRSQNCRNRGLNKTKHSTGLKGAFWNGYRYGAQIRINGKHVFLGGFDTPEEAHAAYVEAARKHHGEFARSK